MLHSRVRLLAGLLLAGLLAPSTWAESKVGVSLPLGRVAYQNNEQIQVAVARSGAAELPAGNLVLTLTGTDMSKLSFTFPVAAVPLAAVEKGAATALRVEHYQLNGSLLRPGSYVLEVAVDGVTATTPLEVWSAQRSSSFVTMDWGGNTPAAQQEIMGEDSMGFTIDQALGYGDNSIRGQFNWMQACVLGGAHQLSINLDSDWSDPYAIIGGVSVHASRVAQAYQSMPNVPGLHFYDEPGLTWWADPDNLDPKTGNPIFTPHMIPSQVRSFESAFGHAPLRYNKVDPKKESDWQQWEHWGRWKEGFMEASWRLGRFAVEWVNPNFISVTQSQYGWNAYTDGYYFNVARSLPIISGHGGYDDLGSGYYCPSFTYEMGRMRDDHKDIWYLPGWYADLTNDRFRLEQYLTFMMGVQGMSTPPWLHMHEPSTVLAADGVVESNKAMLRLGPIFNSLRPSTPTPVALLWSLSQDLHAQSLDMNDNYGGGHHRESTHFAYIAGKLLQVNFTPVVEEDILDGTLAARHQVLVVAGVDYLDPNLISALETYIKQGHQVVLTGESQVVIPGAVKLTAKAESAYAKELAPLIEARDWPATARFGGAGGFFKSAAPLAAELKPLFAKWGIKPVLTTSDDKLAASRQVAGEVEYDFAVNAADDDVYFLRPEGRNTIRTMAATIGLPNDGRPVYDAMRGGEVAFTAAGDQTSASFRFGPGQMRVFARPARPISKVQAITPVIATDLTSARSPITLTTGAMVLDRSNRVIAGAIPLELTVTDPLGQVRGHYFRATDLQGMCRVVVPLAANDPPGAWKVTATELLANTTDTVSVTFAPAAQCGAAAGAVSRALLVDADWEHLYRMFRLYRNFTIVKGTGDYQAAAERLANVLKPWDVQCTIVNVADLKARSVPEDAAKGWQGPGQTSRGTIKAGDTNPAAAVGYDVRTPVLLLGTPEDNALIKLMVPVGKTAGILPFSPQKDVFPGPGRGYLSWQRDVVSFGCEGATLIAYDTKGMDEAIGTLYEVCAGLLPLTPLVQPDGALVTAATTAPAVLAGAGIAWHATLPDHTVGLQATATGAVALSNDGTLVSYGLDGKERWRQTLNGGEHWSLAVAANGALIAVNTQHAVALFDGAGKPGAVLDYSKQMQGPGVQAVAVSPDGKAVFINGRDGSETVVDASGHQVWQVQSLTQAMLDKYTADKATWDAGKDERAALTKAYTEAVAAWKAAGSVKGQEVKAPTLAPAPVQPKVVLFSDALFTANGKTILAVNASTTLLLDATTGNESGKTAGAYRYLAAGDDIWLADAAGVVRRFSADAGKVVAEYRPGSRYPAVLAIAGSDLVVGTEGDLQVRRVKGIAAGGKPEAVWSAQLPQRLAKAAAGRGERVAVAYWGGTLQVLGADGKAITHNVFAQDISELTWVSDTQLVVTLADGQVLGLTVK